MNGLPRSKNEAQLARARARINNQLANQKFERLEIEFLDAIDGFEAVMMGCQLTQSRLADLFSSGQQHTPVYAELEKQHRQQLNNLWQMNQNLSEWEKAYNDAQVELPKRAAILHQREVDYLLWNIGS